MSHAWRAVGMVGALVAALVAAGAAPAARAAPMAGERFVLAWPPSFYESAELAIWRGADARGGAAVSVRVKARGIDEVVDLDEGASRVALPAIARCEAGVDDCALEVTRESGTGSFHVVLQSPSTAGAPDTLVFTAHDTVAARPAPACGRQHVAVSWPTPAASEFPQGAAFVTVVAVDGAGEVSASDALGGVRRAWLETGEAWTLTGEEEGDDLSGLRIESASRVFVLSGNVAATVPHAPGAGLSADYVLDAPRPLDGAPAGATWIVPPVPRAPAWEGRGDVVRIVAGEPSSVRVRDDAGRDETRSLATGDVWDVETAGDGAGADRVVRVDATGRVECWHVLKSRAHRGRGDAAAVRAVALSAGVGPALPGEGPARAFAPEGYGEGTVLTLACEGESALAVDGVGVALREGPAGEDAWAVLDVSERAAVGGLVEVGVTEGRCSGWIVGLGGFKAHGHAALEGGPPESRTIVIARGVAPAALEPIASVVDAERWRDDAAPRRAFYRLEDPALTLAVVREGVAPVLSWARP